MRKAPSRRAVLEALTLGVPLQALLPLAGFSGLSACKDRREAHVEPVGPGQPLPFITPKSKFFQFTRGSLWGRWERSCGLRLCWPVGTGSGPRAGSR